MELLEKYFETAFAAPDGVKRLRELILSLAMRGKLVPQDPSEQPARELLKEIEAEKKRLIKEGKIKKSKPLPEITPDEIPYNLPESWEWVRFGNIAQHNAGKTKDGGRNIGTPRDYITTSNLYWGYFDFNNVRQMPFKDEELEKCTATKGDLLICEGGEAGRAAVWYLDKDICFQNHIHRARFYCNISPYYAYRFFEKLNTNGEIEKYRQGVGISSMSGKTLASIFFPLPPLEEQHRIVEKIARLMEQCDSLEKLKTEREEKRILIHTAAISKVINAPEQNSFNDAWIFIRDNFGELYAVKENINELKKAILQLAVMGKLVPQEPNDPPASELLKEIEAQKERLIKEGKIKKQQPLLEITSDEFLYQIPRGWELTRFGNIVVDIATGPFGLMIHKSDYIQNGIPLINPSHMINGSIIHDPNVSVSHQKALELSVYQLFEGDIVMARRGEMGRCAIVDSKSHHWLCGTGSFILKFVKTINRQYILNLFQSEYIKTYLGGNSVGTTMTNLNHGILKKMPILLPPVPEQHRIVAKVDQLMALCDQLETKIDHTTNTQTKLLKSVLTNI
jgi:type I restriction enzyme S subunit